MEKSANTGKIRFHIGLLNKIYKFVFPFVFLFTSVFAYTQQSISSLTVVPEAEWFFTGEDAGFLLQIPDVSPRQVTVNIKSMPAGVKFVSSYKEDFLHEGKRGTSVKFWFVFEEPGVMQLPPMEIQVGWRRVLVPFLPVTVYMNPVFLMPELAVDFKDAKGNAIMPDSTGKVVVSAGDSTFILVSVLYASQVTQVDWQLSQNALLSELERYPIADLESKPFSFSPKAEPVVLFDWIPLEQGVCSLPDVRVSVVSYGGQRMELALPSVVVESTLNTVKKILDNPVPKALEQAFFEPLQKDEVSGDKIVFDMAVPTTLAKLRVQERFSLPFSGSFAAREEYERQLGLAQTNSERSVPLVICFWVLAAVGFIFLLIFICLKKKYIVIAMAFVALAFAVFGIVYGLPLFSETGVFVGGAVHSIPEENSGTAAPILPLSVVSVLESTGNWLYVEFGATGGWVPRDSVIKISRSLLEE